jgi:hypothetical protein
MTSKRGEKMKFASLGIAGLLALAPLQAIESQSLPAPSALTFADLADLALPAPVVAHVRIRKSDALSAREAPTVPVGYRRFLVEAEILALIRGEGGLPARISYLVDLPQSGGQPARLARRSEHVVLASRAPGRPAELRLVARDAQLPYTPALAEQLRGLLREAQSPDAPPRISGVSRAFHVPGSVPGESETQIFLATSSGRPISLSVLRRPREAPRWAVALGEIIDEAARAPEADSLLWYRLACSLPAALPAASLEGAAGEEAAAIRADYRFVLASLGPCVRSRAP